MDVGYTLLVEDNERIRHSLQKALKLRNLPVLVAGTVEEARELISKWIFQIAVAVFDMRLKDPGHPNMTGADLGLEIRRQYPQYQPEFLIYSGYSQMDYYHLFLELGAAAYLHKEDFDQDNLIRHIRALRMRQALNPQAALVERHVRQITDESFGPQEAVARVCHELLEPVFRQSLNAPFVFLLNQGMTTACCGGNAELPRYEHPLYQTIQALIFAEVRQGEPFILNADKVPNQNTRAETEILNRLHEAAFLPFRIRKDLTLAIGVLQDRKDEFPLAEDPCEMAKVLEQYFRAEILELLIGILMSWAGTDARRRTLLSATGNLCLQAGQDQLESLNDLLARREAFDDETTTQLRLLQDSARDLRDTGRFLNKLDEMNEAPREVLPSAAAVIRELRQDLALENQDLADAILIEGDCALALEKEDLLVIVSRLLQWFAPRFDETPPGQTLVIQIRCAAGEAGAELIFEDRSRRLPVPVRENMFSPFAQASEASLQGTHLPGAGARFPLYLAKMLVEVKYRGTLTDRSEEVQSERSAPASEQFGHRFVVQFSKPAT